MGLEHDRVARFFQHIADQIAQAGEPALHHHGAVLELLGHGALLARPAGPLGRDPHPRAARGRDLAGARPAVDIGGGVDVRARLE